MDKITLEEFYELSNNFCNAQGTCTSCPSIEDEEGFCHGTSMESVKKEEIQKYLDKLREIYNK